MAAGVAALLVGAGAVGWSLLDDEPATPRAAPTPSAADCPVHQTNPAPAPPTHRGDHASFVADVTLPDCSLVTRGQAVQKVWRFKNAGTVPWHGYSLHRVDLPQGRDQCQTIEDVPVPDTEPGDLVDVKVQVTVPDTPVFCFVRFKLMDGRDQVAFPGGRPVNFQLIVG